MFFVLYIAGAGIEVLCENGVVIPDMICEIAHVFVWIGIAATCLGIILLVAGITTAKMSPPVLLQLELQELQKDRKVGLLQQWWMYPFALLLLVGEINLLSCLVLFAAIIRWPLSAAYLRKVEGLLADAE